MSKRKPKKRITKKLLKKQKMGYGQNHRVPLKNIAKTGPILDLYETLKNKRVSYF